MSSLYLSHGRDDFAGGLCRLLRIDLALSPAVSRSSRWRRIPGSLHNWNYLMEHQDEWRKRYGDRRGRPDPDWRPEFNENSAPPE